MQLFEGIRIKGQILGTAVAGIGRRKGNDKKPEEDRKAER